MFVLVYDDDDQDNVENYGMVICDLLNDYELSVLFWR